MYICKGHFLKLTPIEIGYITTNKYEKPGINIINGVDGASLISI
jgi:hypothetical protein